MKYIAVFAVGFILLSFQFIVCQTNPLSVTLTRLIASPRDFDKAVVRVEGFLVIENQPRHAPLAVLYQREEDTKERGTKNGILVIPDPEMIHNASAISGKRVTLVGTFHAVPGPGGSYAPLIKDIKKCNLSP